MGESADKRAARSRSSSAPINPYVHTASRALHTAPVRAPRRCSPRATAPHAEQHVRAAAQPRQRPARAHRLRGSSLACPGRLWASGRAIADLLGQHAGVPHRRADLERFSSRSRRSAAGEVWRGLPALSRRKQAGALSPGAGLRAAAVGAVAGGRTAVWRALGRRPSVPAGHPGGLLWARFFVGGL